jgi:MFS transporter, ACS family, glucarate transporter
LRLRHKVLGLLGALSVLTFVDRLAIAVAGPAIQSELHIRPQEWGWILSAYVLANGIFEVPSGAMGDRYGQRGELTRIVTWWSIFTAVTGWCRGFWQLVVARFLFGIGSAGAYPNSAGVIARWFPQNERAQSQGFVWAASRLGGVVAPLLIVPLERQLGWRSVFWLLGLAGFVWAATWYAFFRNRPESHPAITAAELAEINADTPKREAAGIPWTHALSSHTLWLVVAAYGCYGCVSWFYFTWFPTWLLHSAGFSLDGVLLTALPFFVGFVTNLAGGVLADRLSSRWGPKRALRIIPSVCLAIGSLVLAAMASFHGKFVAVAFSCAGFGVMDLMLPSAWALCTTVGGRLSGTATGLMNTAGQAGGFLCTLLFGYIVEITDDYNTPVWLLAGLVLVSALLFARVDCTQGIEHAAASDREDARV